MQALTLTSQSSGQVQALSFALVADIVSGLVKDFGCTTAEEACDILTFCFGTDATKVTGSNLFRLTFAALDTTEAERQAEIEAAAARLRASNTRRRAA